MPTGLTYKIYEGTDMSLRDYTLTCVTEFGAGYRATDGRRKELPRDKAPIVKVDSFYKDQLEKSKKELEFWLKVKDNPEVSQQLYDEEFSRHKMENEGEENARKTIKERYLEMIDKVRSFNLPKRYDSLKYMMERQLEESMRIDCNPVIPYTLKHKPVDKWVQDKIEYIEEDIVRYENYIKNEEETVSKCNSYLKGLYEALDEVEPLN